MKNFSIVLLLFILSMQLNNTYAQGEHFAPIGAEWCFGSTHTFYDAHYSKCFSEKDTIIMGQPCRKITGYSIYEDGREDEWPPLYVYSTPDTVYRYHDSFQLFVPMYIFNVSKGDTLTYHISIKFNGIPGSSWSDSLFQVVVTKVDSVYVDGEYLRQVWTSPIEDWGFIGSYIERIGSTYAMLGNIFLGSFPETYHRELRAYQDSLLSYQHNEYECEYLPGTAIRPKNTPEAIRIYPNPSDGHVTIDMEGLTGKEGIEIKITDLSGRKVSPIISRGGRRVHIDLSSFPAGIYILAILCDEIASYHKLVKN